MISFIITNLLFTGLQGQPIVEIVNSIAFYNKATYDKSGTRELVAKKGKGKTQIDLMNIPQYQALSQYKSNVTLSTFPGNETHPNNETVKICYQGHKRDNYDAFVTDCRDDPYFGVNETKQNITWILASNVETENDENLKILRKASNDSSIGGLIMMSYFMPKPLEDNEPKFEKPRLLSISNSNHKNVLTQFAWNLLPNKTNNGND